MRIQADPHLWLKWCSHVHIRLIAKGTVGNNLEPDRLAGSNLDNDMVMRLDLGIPSTHTVNVRTSGKAAVE